MVIEKSTSLYTRLINWLSISSDIAHALASTSVRLSRRQGYVKRINYGWNCSDSESGLRRNVNTRSRISIYLMLLFPTRSSKPLFELSDNFYVCSDVSLLLALTWIETCSAKKYSPIALCHWYLSSQKLHWDHWFNNAFSAVFMHTRPKSALHWVRNLYLCDFCSMTTAKYNIPKRLLALLVGVFTTSLGLST